MLWQAVIEQATTSEPLTSVLDSSLLGDEPTDALAPMFAFSPDTAIEVWTERDLSSMHALHRLLIGRADPDLARRLDHAVDWHLDRTQPDNATGRPWAIGVFLMRWIERDDIECRLYAETLLHNCQMLAAKADPLSAEILLDAAEALEEIRDGSRS